MAQASNYFPSQNVELYYQKEAVVGTSPDNNDITITVQQSGMTAVVDKNDFTFTKK